MAVRFDFWQTQREDASNERYADLIINRDYTNEKRPIIRMWRGKQSRPFYNFIIPNGIERAEEIIKKEKNNSGARNKRIADEKSQKKEALNNFQSKLTSGTILTASWGYDQTNVEFYEVISVKGMTATIQEIGQDYFEDGFMSGSTKPDRSKKVGQPIKKESV